MGKYQRIERQIALSTLLMQPRHQLWQHRQRKVCGPHPGVKLIETKINGIGPVRDRGAGTVPIAGGG